MVVRLAMMAALLIACLPLHYLWKLMGVPSPWPRSFLGMVGRVVGARTRIVGTPLTRDVLFVSNHLSWIDILLIAGATGSAFVAKAELARSPLVGWLCRLNDTIFVDRGDRLRIGEQVGRLRDALATARAVTMFPEGTTGDGVSLLPFKAGMFAALDPPPSSTGTGAGVRVQPIRLDYGDATGELAWSGGEHGASHARRVLRRRGSFVATLRLLDPFDPAVAGGRKAISAEARRRMEDAA